MKYTKLIIFLSISFFLILGSFFWYKKDRIIELVYFKEREKLAKTYYNYGIKLKHGEGIKKDDEKAKKWFELAANLNHTHAMCWLGYMHYYGDGVPKNYKEAYKWFSKSTNEIYSQYCLALMNGYGHGVKKNIGEGYKWMTISAKRGYGPAQHQLGLWFEKGFGKRKVETRKSIYWFNKAAKRENADSQNKLGVIYQEGEGVKKNLKQALKWYEMAAQSGNVEHVNNLARLLSTSKNETIFNPKSAMKYESNLVSSKKLKYMDTVACIYASNGMFGKALKKQEDLVLIARRSPIKEDELVAYIKREVMYRKSKVFRE